MANTIKNKVEVLDENLIEPLDESWIEPLDDEALAACVGGRRIELTVSDQRASMPLLPPLLLQDASTVQVSVGMVSISGTYNPDASVWFQHDRTTQESLAEEGVTSRRESLRDKGSSPQAVRLI